jgi:hypothetical protein
MAPYLYTTRYMSEYYFCQCLAARLPQVALPEPEARIEGMYAAVCERRLDAESSYREGCLVPIKMDAAGRVDLQDDTYGLRLPAVISSSDPCITTKRRRTRSVARTE